MDQTQFLCDLVKTTEQYNQIIRSPTESDFPDVLVFKLPDSTNVTCPLCMTELIRTGRFATGENKAQPPRLLYNTHRNVLLVSQMLLCSKCGYFHSHNESLLQQTTVNPPFIIFSRSGATEDFYNFVVTSLSQGKRFRYEGNVFGF